MYKAEKETAIKDETDKVPVMMMRSARLTRKIDTHTHTERERQHGDNVNDCLGKIISRKKKEEKNSFPKRKGEKSIKSKLTTRYTQGSMIGHSTPIIDRAPLPFFPLEYRVALWYSKERLFFYSVPRTRRYRIPFSLFLF